MPVVFIRPRVNNGEMAGRHALRVASRETLPHQSVGTLAWRDMKCEQGITRYLIERRLRAMDRRRRFRYMAGMVTFSFLVLGIVYLAVVLFAEAVAR